MWNYLNTLLDTARSEGRIIIVDNMELMFKRDGAISKISSGLLRRHKLKWCPWCQKVLTITSFKSLANRLAKLCEQCTKLRNYKSNRSIKNRFIRGVAIAKRRNYNWTISLDDYTKLMSNGCQYCGLQLNEAGVGLDRIDNEYGYILENVVPACTECNTGRNNNFTFDEMKLFIGPAIRKVKLARQNYVN